MQSTFSNMANEMKDLKETNSQLEEHIKCLEKEEGLHIGGNIFLTLKRNNSLLKLSQAEHRQLFGFPRLLALSLSH